MQGIFNLLGTVGFVLAAANAALIGVAVVKGPEIIEENFDKIQALMIEKMYESMDGAAAEVVPGEVKKLVPGVTGPAIPF